MGFTIETQNAALFKHKRNLTRKPWPQVVALKSRFLNAMGDLFFTTTGADTPAAQHRYKPVLVIIFLENTREVPKIITSTGAEFWVRFCLSVLVLVIF